MNDCKNDDAQVVIPVIEEQLLIHKQFVEKAKVKIIKKVHEEEATINLSSKSEEVQMQSVPVNRYVDVTPPVRYEDDVIIIPVVKEVLVLQKKLLLVEEVHIKKHIIVTEEKQTVLLKKEEVVIERTPSIDSAI